jgi:hypothetical protein
MSTPYKAIVEGQSCEVQGFDENGSLVLTNGYAYAFERLHFKPEQQPSNEPGGDIIGWPLLEVVKLQQWQGDWKWNDEPSPLSKWMRDEFANAGSKHSDSPEYFKRAVTKARLTSLRSDDDRERINGVAWFRHDDGADGWNTPFFLSHFRSLPKGLNPEELAKTVVTNIKNAGDAAEGKIRAATSQLKGAIEELAKVAEPFREMYKDERLAGAKSEALKAGIPELVVDAIVSQYHKIKMPTTDGLIKYLNSSGISTKLEASDRGTSRSAIARWLGAFKGIMYNRGLIERTRLKRNSGGQNLEANYAPDENKTGRTSASTLEQELSEGSES